MSEAQKVKSPIDTLQELLNEAGIEPYINPFWDSKNALIFGDYIKNVRKVLKENAALSERLREAEGVIEFYADPQAWTRRPDEMEHRLIDIEDCADYPHVTRDVRRTGGRLAREYLSKTPKEGG